MPSSTSSSSEVPPRATLGGRDKTALACVLATVGTLALVTIIARFNAPAAAWQADIVSYQLPPEEGDYYLAYDRGSNIEHHVLFHGSDPIVLEQMRRADVLFLGNSRLMFALHRPALERFFDALDTRYYVIGFGHNERDDFPEAVIRAHDLRPKVVVVNVDGFFWDERSAAAAKATQESVFDAWKIQVEGEAAHAVRRELHRLVPHYVDLYRGHREFIIYRSRLDGAWFVANHLGEGTSFEWPPGDRHQPSERSLRAAEAFQQEMNARGAKVILCLVPAPNVSIHRARALAAHIGVPLVIPDISGMRTVDGSHLSATSAWRFEQVFLDALRQPLQDALAQ